MGEEDEEALTDSCALALTSLLRPRSSFHRVVQRGALGEKRSEISISSLRQDLRTSGDPFGSVLVVLTVVVLEPENFKGTSFPSEKSSSAESIVTGSSRQNSKSTTGSWLSGDGSDCCLSTEEERLLSSWVNDIRGLVHPYDENFSGETPALLTQAEAINLVLEMLIGEKRRIFAGKNQC